MRRELCKIKLHLWQFSRYKDLNTIIEKKDIENGYRLSHVNLISIIKVWRNFNDIFITNYFLKYINLIHFLLGRKRAVYLLRDQKNIMAFMWLYFNPYEVNRRIVHLGAYFINPLYRGGNVGKIFVNEVIEQLKENDKIAGIAARVEKENVASFKLLSYCGFKIENSENPTQYYLLCRWRNS